jgi:hypothetical protein
MARVGRPGSRMAYWHLVSSGSARPPSVVVEPRKRFLARYHGRAGMERWAGLGLLAHNLRQTSQVVAARRAA